MSAQPAVPCPTCGRSTRFLSEPVGPFCSRRCQLIDLGKWFGEEYRVSDPLPPEDPSAEHEEDERGPLDEPD